MQISIDKISLRNFKGIKSLDVAFGQETNIYGENATGKTTIFDAFTWTLFGKDSLNSAAFEIKALDQHGQEAHNLEHSVEVALSVDSRPMVFKRVYLDIRGYEKIRTAKSEMAKTPRPSASGMHIQ